MYRKRTISLPVSKTHVSTGSDMMPNVRRGGNATLGGHTVFSILGTKK